MGMPVRSYKEASSFRYGFNGQEKENEIKGEGNHYDFGARALDTRLGRWVSVDSKRILSPDETPYRFGHNNPLQFRDPDGNWEEDGHFWTVYAMGITMGLSKSDARAIAVKAEYYDHIVHANNSMSITPLPGKSFLSWGKDGGAGTWADPTLQVVYHGLSGGDQNSVLNTAISNVLMGDLNQLHTVGDAWAHSYMEKGKPVMYGQKGRNEPWYSGLGRLVFGDITYEHAKGGPEHGKIADNISDRPEEYGNYIQSLIAIFSNSKFEFNSKITVPNPNISIFNYVQKHGKTKENNVFLFSSFIDLKSGTKEFSSTNKNQIDLFEGYLKQEGIGYSRFTTTTTETNYSSVGTGGVTIPSTVTNEYFNIKIKN